MSDPALLAELAALGFTPETVSVLPLVPIVEMAWAEGGVTAAERDAARHAGPRAAASRKAAPPIDSFRTGWRGSPRADVFARATRLIRAMLDTGSPASGTLTADDLIKYSESIAAASGGILGIGKISAEERATLAKIVAALKARGEGAGAVISTIGPRARRARARPNGRRRCPAPPRPLARATPPSASVLSTSRHRRSSGR